MNTYTTTMWGFERLDMRREKTYAQRREQRAKEAITCLKLTGHNPKLGLLLDLGCGLGNLTRYFLKLGIEAVGMDISRELMKLAKKKNVPSGSFVLADGVKLPFREESFNTVILNDVLEHVHYNFANPMLNEVRRSLKVDGKLYISVANKYQIREPHTHIPFLTWFPRPCWNSIYRFIRKRPMPSYYPYTTRKLKRLCRETSFTCKNYTWFYTWNKISNIKHIGDQTLKRMAKTIKKLRLSKQAYLFAEKVSEIVFVCVKQNQLKDARPESLVQT